PGSRLNPGMQYFLQTLIPLPNTAGSASNFVNATPKTTNRDIYVGRLDQPLSDRDSLFFRARDQHVAQVTPQACPTLISLTGSDGVDLAGGWQSVPNPKSVLDIRFGYHNPYGPVQNINTLGLSRSTFLQKTGFHLLDSDTNYSVLPTIAANG